MAGRQPKFRARAELNLLSPEAQAVWVDGGAVQATTNLTAPYGGYLNSELEAEMELRDIQDRANYTVKAEMVAALDYYDANNGATSYAPGDEPQ